AGVAELHVGAALLAPDLLAGVDRAVTGLGDRDAELVDLLQAEAELGVERSPQPLGGRNELGVGRHLQLGQKRTVVQLSPPSVALSGRRVRSPRRRAPPPARPAGAGPRS